MSEDIVTRLNEEADLAANEGVHDVAKLIWESAATIAALRAENANLKTVMVAAAEEISAHWQAHCDSEGYGPQNLVRRLEEGIPSEYGYTAGAFAALRAEVERLEMDAERYRWLRENYAMLLCSSSRYGYRVGFHTTLRSEGFTPEMLDAAIAQAKERA